MSVAGKERSRRNALKHGLTGEGTVLTPEDAAKVEALMPAYRDMFKPVGTDEEWQVKIYVTERVRIDKLFELELKTRRDEIEREAHNWVRNREAEAAQLGMRIRSNPEMIARKLETTMWGAYWLRDRWQGLRATLESGKTWDAEESRLALDLLGQANDLRGPGRTPIDAPEGEDPLEYLLVLVDEQIQMLDERIDGPLLQLDESHQIRVLKDLNLLNNPQLKALRRMETGLFRRLDMARRILEQKPSARTAAASTRPIAEPEPPAWTDEDTSESIAEPEPPAPAAEAREEERRTPASSASRFPQKSTDEQVEKVPAGAPRTPASAVPGPSAEQIFELFNGVFPNLIQQDPRLGADSELKSRTTPRYRSRQSPD
jgi:hypothetical protein